MILLLMLFDIFLLIAFFKLAQLFISNNYFYPAESLIIVFVLSWVVAALFGNTYQIENLNKTSSIALSTLLTTLASSLITIVYVAWLLPEATNCQILLYLYCLSFLGIFLIRIAELKMYRFLRTLKNNRKNVVVVGYTPAGRRLQQYFTDSEAGDYNFLGFFDDEEISTDNTLKLGELKDVQRFCVRENVDEIYYALPNHASLVNRLTKFADEHYIHFGLVQDIGGLSNKKIDTHLYDDGRIPIVTPRRDPLRFFFNQQVKRVFDICFSSFVIFCLFPFIVPVIALIIKIDSKGPVFFKQLRSGKNGKPFWCYKFRTMTVNQDADSKQATKNDARITKVGKILRKTSVDELPQFYNVLIGDMSVVGPRPHMLKHTEEYSAIINNFNVRHFIHSGITGYAQVNGYRGETKDNRQMEQRVIYDNWYLENWSLTLDIKIIIKTVLNAFKGEKNAY